MASEPTLSGSSSEGLTPAQKLMERHGEDSHNPTVEEVIDQEDIDHPPPSMVASTASTNEAAPSAPTPAEPLSDKAAGKQPATDTPAPKSRGSQAPLDTQSEELFPALGAPKSRAAAAPTPWSHKPAAVGKAANGVNGLANGSAARNSASSGTSAPAPGIMTPSSAAPSMGGMSLPGRHTERIQFAPSQLTPRPQLKKPMADILRDINKRSKAKVGMSQGAGGIVTFESTGPTADVVRQALKEVASLLGSKVCRGKSISH